MTKKHETVRRFNRAVYNRIARLFAGKFVYALVRHTGRKSGREYSTPVVAEAKNDFIFIPLPYGADTDWYLNIQAAGKCSVQIKGRVYSAGSPEVVNADSALPAFSNFHQKAFKRFKIEEYLRLKVN